LFQIGDYRNKSHNPDKTILGSIPDRDGAVAEKLSVTEEQHQHQRTRVVCFGKEIAVTKATTLKKPGLGSSHGREVTFRDIFSYSLIRPVDSFQAIKIDMKCKLSPQ
jgi:hypothetical protein